MGEFKVVYYKIVKDIKGTITLFNGSYSQCLEFLLKNKGIYLTRGIDLKIILN